MWGSTHWLLWLLWRLWLWCILLICESMSVYCLTKVTLTTMCFWPKFLRPHEYFRSISLGEYLSSHILMLVYDLFSFCNWWWTLNLLFPLLKHLSPNTVKSIVQGLSLNVAAGLGLLFKIKNIKSLLFCLVEGLSNSQWIMWCLHSIIITTILMSIISIILFR
jgi:hypothetical protein